MKATLENIVEEARELFRDRGYAGMSMQDLAERVGLKKPSLYTRFPNKEALVPEVLKLTVAETMAGVPQDVSQGDDDWRAAYKMVLERIAGTLADRKRCVGGHLALGISDETPIARAAVQEFFVSLRDGIAATLRPALDPDLATSTATDALNRLEGASVWLAATGDSGALSKTVATLLAEADTFKTLERVSD